MKKDMEADDKLRKDWERVQKSSERMRETGAVGSEKMGEFGEKVKSSWVLKESSRGEIGAGHRPFIH